MRRLLLAFTLLLSAGLAPAVADASQGLCLPPAAVTTCDVTTGKVTYVSDGDTFWVDLNGDNSRKTYSIRITGINAMEQTVYSRYPSRRRGECHALEATAALEDLLRRAKWKVRLAAQDPVAHSRTRLRRSVQVKVRGRWIDVGRRMMAEGHALWLPNYKENAWNAEYARTGEWAASLQRGIWNPTYCGAGPNDESPLKVTVNSDSRAAGGEWVRIRNLDPVNSVPLAGWSLRDSLTRYAFPEWAVVPPADTLTVYVLEGEDTFTELFWGRQNTLFDNPGKNGMGDGAYLFDPQGDLRASMTYPCTRNCADPYTGAVDINAKPDGNEYVTVTNIAAFAVDLEGYQLQSPPFAYAFPRDSVLQPGESMRIDIVGDPGADTRLEKSWGETGRILNDGGDKVRISNFRGQVLDCVTWGRGKC